MSTLLHPLLHFVVTDACSTEVSELLWEGKHAIKAISLRPTNNFQQWGCSLGAVTAMEMLLRDQDKPAASWEVLEAVQICALLVRNSLGIMTALTSLVATARKLLRTLTAPDPKFEIPIVHASARTAAILAGSVKAVGQVLEGRTQQMHKSAAGAFESSKSSSGGGANIFGSFSQPSHGSSDWSLLSQLQAIQIVTLVQLCEWVGRVMVKHPEAALTVAGNNGPTQQGAPGTNTASEARFGSNDLTRLACALLAWSPRATSEAELAANAACERFAVAKCNGRLVPGCCNLGCTNLEGFSEVALPTRLCSGCRQARYCSVECQKEAWKEGGHSTVCNLH